MDLQCCVETTNRTRCHRAYMRTLSHGGNTTRRGRFLPNKPNRRNALSVKELSVRAPSHTVFPSVVADIRPVRVSVIYFASPRITGASFMPPCIFPAIYLYCVINTSTSFRGARQVGRADLPANPESITPGGDVRPPVPPHGLWSWIPGSARYARGPGMTAQFGL
jgi:hypothetical protein